MREITEKTLVPLTLVLGIVTFTMWLTQLSAQVQMNAKRIDAIELKQDVYNESVHKIQTDIALIKQAVGVGEARRQPSQDESK